MKRTVALCVVLGAVTVPGRPAAETPPAARVLAPDEGEALVAPNGEVVVKVDPRTGSARLAMGTQHVTRGGGIQVHRHLHEDEILFVHRGAATGIVGDTRRALEAGSTVYVPEGVWHGIENADSAVDLVWVVTPPGLEEYFRDVRAPRGKAPKVLTPEQLEDVRKKHGMQVRPKEAAGEKKGGRLAATP